ncbi:hypothetical protein LDENG_00257830 [Lucifuga dentata]|nr:hypothetical protein LDENG_00257830 [Lucifuga dentata]
MKTSPPGEQETGFKDLEQLVKELREGGRVRVCLWYPGNHAPLGILATQSENDWAKLMQNNSYCPSLS